MASSKTRASFDASFSSSASGSLHRVVYPNGQLAGARECGRGFRHRSRIFVLMDRAVTTVFFNTRDTSGTVTARRDQLACGQVHACGPSRT
jgi:hypothetical protein